MIRKYCEKKIRKWNFRCKNKKYFVCAKFKISNVLFSFSGPKKTCLEQEILFELEQKIQIESNRDDDRLFSIDMCVLYNLYMNKKDDFICRLNDAS